MTKKDYQAIARGFYNLFNRSEFTAIQKGMIIDELAASLHADNPRFNWGLFQEACLTGKCKGMKGGK